VSSTKSWAIRELELEFEIELDLIVDLTQSLECIYKTTGSTVENIQVLHYLKNLTNIWYTYSDSNV